MDLLDRLLGLMPVSGTLDLRCQFGSPWRLFHQVSESHEIPYHILLRGVSVVEDDAGEPIRMRAGDVLMFPSGAAHYMHDGSGETPIAHSREPEGMHAVVTNHGAGAPTDLLCGRFLIPLASRHLLRDQLPGRLLVHSLSGPATEVDPLTSTLSGNRLVRLIEMMREEALEQSAGSNALVNHLSAALFGLTLRFAGESGQNGYGVLALSQQPRLQAALTAMFDDPGRAWTQDELAALCHMSRATFARHFNDAMGKSANDLLFEIRMAVAGRKLAQTTLPVIHVGLDVGYQSGAAFQRVFKKHTGLTPAQWRARAHAELMGGKA
ncbi:AraC family transcriptional regulator, activator of mtrCDE [Pararobbsia alpina]|uniref:cupin domain-containing protein n=1 Tax=Pararobbsia alpina TaxID=621374 RepID=UPI0039A747E0